MLLKLLNGDTINGLKNFKLALIKVPVLTGLTIGLTKKKKE